MMNQRMTLNIVDMTTNHSQNTRRYILRNRQPPCQHDTVFEH